MNALEIFSFAVVLGTGAIQIKGKHFISFVTRDAVDSNLYSKENVLVQYIKNTVFNTKMWFVIAFNL